MHQGLGLCFAQKTAGGRGGLGCSPAVVPGEVSWEGPLPKRGHQGEDGGLVVGKVNFLYQV